MELSQNYSNNENYYFDYKNNHNPNQSMNSLSFINQKLKRRKRISSNALIGNYSLSNNNLNSFNNNNLKSFRNPSSEFQIKNYVYRNNKINKYNNNNIEKDLDIMKIQLRCDLITQKINQIQNQVQNLHESSIKDDIKLLNKNAKSRANRENFILLKKKNLSIESPRQIEFYEISNFSRNNLTCNANHIERKIKNNFFNINNMNQSNIDNYRTINNNGIHNSNKTKKSLKTFLLNSRRSGQNHRRGT